MAAEKKGPESMETATGEVQEGKRDPLLTPFTRQEAIVGGKEGISCLGVGLPGWGEWIFDKLAYQFLNLIVWIVFKSPLVNPNFSLSPGHPQGFGLDGCHAFPSS